jgi:SAM-dependent methyltransferase
MSHQSFIDDVRHYYDQNTLRFAQHDSGGSDAVHRAVWGPGVETAEESFQYINRLLADHLRDLPCARLLDMGCGIGGSLFHLCGDGSRTGTGVTLSKVQIRLAQERAQELGLEQSCQFMEANYLELPKIEPVGAAFAVESFVHGPDPQAFFHSASGQLIDGGRLIICDDFLTDLGARTQDRKHRQHLADFRRGWHVGCLITTQQAREMAMKAGLQPIESLDLTGYLKLRQGWDQLISLGVACLRVLPLSSPWWHSWLGGNGIQMCLAEKLVEFRFQIFAKTPK